MPNIKYVPWKPSEQSAKLVVVSLQILEDYAEQGYQLTLRQLYYQLVARDYIPNTQKSYNNLGSIISRAREAGMIDWHYILDRTRTVRELPHWEGPKEFLQSAAPQFKLDLWEGQPTRVIVFVEKQALEEVVGKACDPLDVPYFANKGYLSSSSAWEVAHNRMLKGPADRWVVLHLGDHDPSGIDMTRDIADRLRTFSCPYYEDQRRPQIHVSRIALNRDQVEQYNPPPNPAKTTDSRFASYWREHGTESWELDALEPRVIHELVQQEIKVHLERPQRLALRKRQQRKAIEQLQQLAEEQ